MEVASRKAKYVVVGLAIAVLLSAALLSTPALAESTYSLLRETLLKVTDIKTTLSSGGTVYEMINTIKGWAAPGGILSLIKEKTDLLPPWGDIVTKNWADLTGYIDKAKAAIITEVDTRLSTADFNAWKATLGDIVTKNLADVVTSIWTGKDKVAQVTALQGSTDTVEGATTVLFSVEGLTKPVKLVATVDTTGAATSTVPGTLSISVKLDGTNWRVVSSVSVDGSEKAYVLGPVTGTDIKVELARGYDGLGTVPVEWSYVYETAP
jgi:hypothetical protein